MLKITLSSALLGVLLITAACGDKFTRSKAVDMIKNSDAFAPNTEQAKLGICIGMCRQDPIRPLKIAYNNALRDAGYITISPASPDSWNAPRIHIVLTQKGRDAAKQWTAEPEIFPQPYPDYQYYSFHAGRPEFLDITGIQTFPERRIARAEFTWKYVPSPIVEELRKNGWKIQSSPTEPFPLLDKVYRGTAEFQLYDDGWRLQEAARHLD